MSTFPFKILLRLCVYDGMGDGAWWGRVCVFYYVCAGRHVARGPEGGEDGLFFPECSFSFSGS